MMDHELLPLLGFVTRAEATISYGKPDSRARF
jgi:hypothetical protein